MKVLEAIRVLDRNGRFAPKLLDADGEEIREKRESGDLVRRCRALAERERGE